MMTHLKVLGIKFIVMTITVLSLFSIFNYAVIGNMILIGLITTVVTYLLGDMIILRRFGNVAASIADFGLAFLSYWLLARYFIGASEAVMVTALAAAFFTACVEPFIHEYIATRLFSEEVSQPRQVMNQLQTEFAEEVDFERDISSTDQKDEK